MNNAALRQSSMLRAVPDNGAMLSVNPPDAAQ